MKKALFLLVVILSAILLSATAFATDANLSGDAVSSAEALKELDLFRGTDKGFELEKPMTRAEAAAMLVRFLGAEEEYGAGSRHKGSR